MKIWEMQSTPIKLITQKVQGTEKNKYSPQDSLKSNTKKQCRFLLKSEQPQYQQMRTKSNSLQTKWVTMINI